MNMSELARDMMSQFKCPYCESKKIKLRSDGDYTYLRCLDCDKTSPGISKTYTLTKEAHSAWKNHDQRA
jgi:ribosomal protein L37AE/L43A